MSYQRTIRRNVRRVRLQRATDALTRCPVCGCDMRRVWYSRHKRKCPVCGCCVIIKWADKEAHERETD